MAVSSEISANIKDTLVKITSIGTAVVGLLTPMTACGYPVGEPTPITTNDGPDRAFFDVPAGTPVYPGPDVSREVPCGAVAVKVADRTVSEEQRIAIPVDRRVYTVVQMAMRDLAGIDGVNVADCKNENGTPLSYVWAIREYEAIK
jgi:hypothetical protein